MTSDAWIAGWRAHATQVPIYKQEESATPGSLFHGYSQPKTAAAALAAVAAAAAPTIVVAVAILARRQPSASRRPSSTPRRASSTPRKPELSASDQVSCWGPSIN